MIKRPVQQLYSVCAGVTVLVMFIGIIAYISYFQKTIQNFPATTEISKNKGFSPSFPDEIVRRLNGNKGPDELRKIWDKLGIKEEESYFFTDDDLTTTVKLDNVQFEGKEESAAILTISDQYDSNVQYLVFIKSRSGWNFAGNIDMGMLKGNRPTYRTVKTGNKIWLAVRFLTGSGTGMWEESEVWYQFTPGKLKEVLKYPVKTGLAFGWAPLIESSGKVIKTGEINGLYAIETEYQVRYSHSYLSNAEDFLNETKRVQFVWNPYRQKFVIDEFNSDCTMEELENAFGIDTKDFLKKYYNDLLKIAVGPDESKKKLLEDFLTNSEVKSPERTKLLNRIRSKPYSGQFWIFELEKRLIRNGQRDSLWESYWVVEQGQAVVPYLDVLLDNHKKYTEETGAFPFNAIWALSRIGGYQSERVLEKYKDSNDSQLALKALKFRKKNKNLNVLILDSKVYKRSSSTSTHLANVKEGEVVVILETGIHNYLEGGPGGDVIYDYVEIPSKKVKGYIVRADDEFPPFY